ncbi:unnamed protein product, partial [Heterotrigona itama]
GFYSKDLIIERYIFKKINTFRFFILILSTIFTISYSFRIINNLASKNLILNLIFNQERKIINSIIQF